ncbi:hypothetical protein BKA69DRAFT_639948 [Paraphysoderma sedebokerense]|nr:hypothetical protein BKA69DRAFT_639948 [Paraphysoderma sedebokerense]
MTLSLLNCLLVSLLAGALASPQQTPAETPAERDCRLKGVCERNGVKCLKMERFNMCKAFTDAFMPMDITDFLNTKLPGVDWGKSPPRPFVDTDDINGWFGNLTSKAGIYNKREAGCEAPSQRWWNTWKPLQFYQKSVQVYYR